MKQFEYLQVFIPAKRVSFKYTIQDYLNEQGKQGWEAITVLPHRKEGTLIQYEIYFKRETVKA